MKDDFHYYLIYALAEKTGWNNVVRNDETEADIIAYASQYVDDNTESQTIGVKEADLTSVDYETIENEIISNEIQRYQGFPWKVRIGNDGDFFRPIMTQTMSLKSLVPMFQKYVLVPFHFLPGDKEKIPEIRGRKNPYSTTPNSTNAVKIIKDAFDSGDIYRIGVALHTFVDTWSHQNFTGYHDDWNAVRKDPLGKILPDVGHAEATTKPDIISETWTDSRLSIETQNINNAERALEAVRESFQWLAKYRNARMTWEDVRADFEQLIAAKNTKERIKMVKDMYPRKKFAYKEKERKTWIKEAVEHDKEKKGFFATQDFFSSHWYKFQLAAKKQLSTVVNMLADII